MAASSRLVPWRVIMKSTYRFLCFAAALVVLSLSGLHAATWEFDPAHSAATFSVRHLMISNVRGECSNLAGSVEWDGKGPEGLKIDASVDVTTINTREPKRDAHLKSPDFFDAEKFPKMTFRSKSATSAGANRYRVVGDLTIRGVTKEATWDVEVTPLITDPWGNTKFGAVATTKVNRQDFGVKWNKALDGGGVVVGDEIEVTIDAELAQKKEAPPPAGKKN